VKVGRSRRTLTTKQWQFTLKHFNFRCAYCSGPYQVLEHVVPVELGGGTTYTNCVPACNSCNTCKDHPKFLLLGSNERAVEALLKVKVYFQSLQDETFDEKLLDTYIEMQRTKVPKHR
jgi:hypothetical protein